MLVQLAENLWEHIHWLPIAGFRLPRRMTVIRLEDGGLWVHSPNRLDPELKAALAALGPVRHVVAPNRFHHFFVDELASAYPEARFYAAPGLPEKRPGLRFDEVLGDTAPEAWRGQIEQLPTLANRGMSEVHFFHPASKTLILTDWAFNIGPSAPFPTRVFGRLWVGSGLGPSRWFRARVKNTAGVRRTIDRILDTWDVGRILLAHGDGVEQDAPEALRKAFAAFR
jgi:hypothetical protein